MVPGKRDEWVDLGLLGDDDGPTAGQRAYRTLGWTRQRTGRPVADRLQAYRKRVIAQPLDRGARTRLASTLWQAGECRELLGQALEWQPFDPENPAVYEFAGQALGCLNDSHGALRAYTSIVETSPGDSGLLNRAGFLCLRSGQPVMAEQLFRLAIGRRPDHVNNHRGLALALWLQGRYHEAIGVLAAQLKVAHHPRYRNVRRILREEAWAIARSWFQAQPEAVRHRDNLIVSLGRPPREDALRITLHWETDANDVDLHVADPRGEECYYEHKLNASGLRLYEDLTQGLGPEVMVVPVGRLVKGRYHVGVNYYTAGPMGVSRGIVVIQRPGTGGRPDVRIEPFCLLPDQRGEARDMRHVAVVVIGTK